jgi:hypothetical protein
MAAAELEQRTERPAYVRFERVPVEDKPASLAAGHFVAKDVDYALITPPYSRDVIRIKVSQWMLNLEQDLRNERIPRQWIDQYKEAYRAWQNGQEIPLRGVPIRGWGVISPAQQETLLRMNIMTVEDLAGINDEGIRRIGMGGTDLKNKAVAWIKQLDDKGPLTQENAALKREIDVLRAANVVLEETVKRLQHPSDQVLIDDEEESLIEEAPVKRGPGRPRKAAEA